jgi:hypothetical protein
MNRIAASTERTHSRFGFRRGVLLVLGAAIIGVATPAAVSAGAKPRCQPAPPSVIVHNTYGWSAFGTWATPGQRVPYAVQVSNWSCSTATVAASISVPPGFTVEPASVSVSLGSRQSAIRTVYVTSPADVAVADYAVLATASSATRTGVVVGNTATSYYKVYTSDVLPPTPALQSHADGSTVSGSVQLSHSFRDDHMARRADLYIDGAPVRSFTNEGITWELNAAYTWDTRSQKGQHTVEWRAYDDFGNPFVDTWVLTVQ